MANHTSCEGEIIVGAWGGWGGNDWSYKVKRGIKQIIMVQGAVIDSIMFKADNDGSSTVENSAKFGGVGGSRTHKVDINLPSEFLTGISGTYGRLGHTGTPVVHSLKFYTNKTHHGPFGTESGCNPFSFQAEGGVITGFHGRAGSYLDSIGVYIRPSPSPLMVTAIGMREHSQIELRCQHSRLPRSAGPWGSVNGGGKAWDDGVFVAVKQVQVHVNKGLISAVQFEYEKKDGTKFWSPMHGYPSKEIVKKVEIDGTNEFLIAIEGFYGPVQGIANLDVITSLTFITNKGKYGPIGVEIGTYFTSLSTPIACSGKVVGFHGRSDAYLDAIGIHTEY